MVWLILRSFHFIFNPHSRLVITDSRVVRKVARKPVIRTPEGRGDHVHHDDDDHARTDGDVVFVALFVVASSAGHPLDQEEAGGQELRKEDVKELEDIIWIIALENMFMHLEED